jgi:histidyl-tRNA synthetase
MKSVRGTRDLVQQNYDKYQYFASLYQKHMSTYGFRGIEPAILEHLELFGSELGQTSDVVSKEMYVVRSLNDIAADSDTVLRPEGTVPAIRATIASGNIDDSFLRLFYYGPMFRYNRPQKGRARQFYHFGCECLNSDDPYTDAEIIECLMSLLHKTLDNQNYMLHINTLGCGPTEEYRKVLYEYFKRNLGKLTELNKNRLDINVMRVLDQLNDDEKAKLTDMPNILDFINPAARERFKIVCDLLDKGKIRYNLDPYLVRGLDYYRNTVFEVMYEGSAIAGGGAYSFDRAKFAGGNKKLYGIGWAIGYERIEELIQNRTDKTVSLFLHGHNPSCVYEVAKFLREHGLKCFTFYQLEKNYIKKAVQLGADYIVTCNTYGNLQIKQFSEEWTDTPDGLLSRIMK